MITMIWECNGCGKVVEDGPHAHDDRGGKITVCGPRCEECDQSMHLSEDQDSEIVVAKEPPEWWQAHLRPGEDYVADASSIEDYVSHDVQADEIEEEMRHSAILYHDGRREPAPLTHVGWSLWIDLHSNECWHDDDEGPVPVVVCDFGARDGAKE